MKKIFQLLEKNKIPHDVISHKLVYTAVDLASTLKKKLNGVAKNLLVKADKKYFVVVLPADKNLNLEKFRACIQKSGHSTKVLELPKESVMKRFLKLKKYGMAVFGSVYKLPVIIDKSLSIEKKAIFSVGDFCKSVEMKVKDFIKLEKPLIGIIGEARKKVTAKKEKKGSYVSNKT
jgi:prolyl-tRNA editing enzyme YbaK/EbsC (Cys-tRNA(Pro) deacylase)